MAAASFPIAASKIVVTGAEGQKPELPWAALLHPSPYSLGSHSSSSLISTPAAAPVRWARSALFRHWLRYLFYLISGIVLGSFLWTGAYRLINPPGTLLMLLNWMDGQRVEQRWIPYSEISPNLIRAVIAAEDARFCQHWGIDWEAVQAAWRHNQAGGQMRGASTITMQTAKNLFLWPDRSYLRKGAELYFTFLLEGLHSKRRIMELYLNIAEWGEGIYGAEAAARHHFRKPAATLTRREAALLAAALPDPLQRFPGKPNRELSRRAGIIEARMKSVPVTSATPCP